MWFRTALKENWWASVKNVSCKPVWLAVQSSGEPLWASVQQYLENNADGGRLRGWTERLVPTQSALNLRGMILSDMAVKVTLCGKTRDMTAQPLILSLRLNLMERVHISSFFFLPMGILKKEEVTFFLVE